MIVNYKYLAYDTEEKRVTRTADDEVTRVQFYKDVAALLRKACPNEELITPGEQQ